MQAEQVQTDASQAAHCQVDSKQVGALQMLDKEASQQEAKGCQEGAQEREVMVWPHLWMREATRGPTPSIRQVMMLLVNNPSHVCALGRSLMCFSRKQSKN